VHAQTRTSRVLLRSEQSDGQVSVIETNPAPGVAPPLHHHVAGRLHDRGGRTPEEPTSRRTRARRAASTSSSRTGSRPRCSGVPT
jgi:diadenosine tetraphosphate (Ap4A) HIT family hydrolase